MCNPWDTQCTSTLFSWWFSYIEVIIIQTRTQNLWLLLTYPLTRYHNSPTSTWPASWRPTGRATSILPTSAMPQFYNRRFTPRWWYYKQTDWPRLHSPSLITSLSLYDNCPWIYKELLIRISPEFWYFTRTYFNNDYFNALWWVEKEKH